MDQEEIPQPIQMDQEEIPQPIDISPIETQVSVPTNMNPADLNLGEKPSSSELGLSDSENFIDLLCEDDDLILPNPENTEFHYRNGKGRLRNVVTGQDVPIPKGAYVNNGKLVKYSRGPYKTKGRKNDLVNLEIGIEQPGVPFEKSSKRKFGSEFSLGNRISVKENTSAQIFECLELFRSFRDTVTRDVSPSQCKRVIYNIMDRAVVRLDKIHKKSLDVEARIRVFRENIFKETKALFQDLESFKDLDNIPLEEIVNSIMTENNCIPPQL